MPVIEIKSTAEIKAIVKHAVHDTLIALGVDISTPEGVLEHQKDQHYLRSSRLQSEKNKSNIIEKTLNAIVAGALAFLAMGFFQSLDVLGR